MIIKLNRSGDKVYYEGEEVAIVKQASKGSGHEALDLSKYVPNDVQKNVQLSNLVEGENVIELKPRRQAKPNSGKLTEDEKAMIAKLEARIKEIKDAAKARKVKRLEDMNIEELQAFIDAKRAKMEAAK